MGSGYQRPGVRVGGRADDDHLAGRVGREVHRGQQAVEAHPPILLHVARQGRESRPGLVGEVLAAQDRRQPQEIHDRDRIARRRGRPEAAIKVMEEELDSPCTEEMAAFDQFIDYASQSDWEAVVFDTAPTGHTMRLLELPMDWSQQIDVKVFASVDTSAADDVAKQRFGQVIEMMRDPAQSTFAFVMYPESTPVVEAWRAAQELATVGIKPGLVVANMVIPPEAATTPFVRARRQMQEKYLAEIKIRFATPVLEIPLLPQEVKGLEMLEELGVQAYGALAHNTQAVPA